LKVTSASPCCQPRPMSVPPQYWHCVTGSCFVIVVSSVSVFLQTHNSGNTDRKLMKEEPNTKILRKQQ